MVKIIKFSVCQHFITIKPEKFDIIKKLILHCGVWPVVSRVYRFVFRASSCGLDTVCVCGHVTKT